jgi:CBS domain-containing protein
MVSLFENEKQSGLKIAPAVGKPRKGGIMKKVKDIMTKDPVCCTPQDSVMEAAQLMKHGDVGSVPVVKDRKAKKLVGIVTDRDLALKVLAEGRDPNNTRVEEVMTRNPVSCREDDDLQNCLDGMEKRQIRRMPIVDREDRIVGIIAQADVATRGGQPDKTAELVEEISE